ncbi:MAG: flagellar biosynthetic protein FliP, partial [Bermanella sp.]
MTVRSLMSFFTLVLFSFSTWAENDFGIPAVTYQPTADGNGQYSVTIQILAIMTMLTVIPSLLIMMTS